jgi:hypothetical protein
MTTIDEQISKNLESYRRMVAEIRNNPRLSEQAKAEDIRKSWEKAQARYTELAEEKRHRVRANLDKKRKEALGAPTVFGSDKANVLSSYRSALDRADAVKDSREFRELLERSELIGDTIMKRALLHRAYALQDDKLVGAVLEKDLDHRPKWDAFMDAAEESNRLEVMGIAGSPDRPPEATRQGVYSAAGIQHES